MSSGWQVKKLSDVCSIDKKKHVHRKLPYVGMEDIESATGVFLGTKESRDVQSSTFEFDSHHVLYGRLRPYLNKVLLPDFDGHCSTEIFPIRVSKNLERRFLFYWLTKSDTVDKIDKTSTGARMPRGDVNELMTFEILVPPLSEQQRIVAVLDEAFAGIATATDNAKKNLQNARELFESHLQSIFTTKGDGWVEKTLENVCTLQRGFDLPTHERKIGIFPLVSSSGISDTIDTVKVTAPGVTTGRSGSIGNVFYIEQDFWPLNTVLYVKDFHGNNARFIYYLLRQFNLHQYASGTGVPTLNRNHVHDILVSVPHVLEQQRIVAQLDALATETKRLEAIYQQKLGALAELKQSILQKAFAGELNMDRLAA